MPFLLKCRFYFCIKIKSSEDKLREEFRILNSGYFTGLCTNQEARSICLFNWIVLKFYALCAFSNYGSDPATLRSMKLLICIVYSWDKPLQTVFRGLGNHAEWKSGLNSMRFFSCLLLEFIILNNFAASLIVRRSPDLLLYKFNYSSTQKMRRNWEEFFNLKDVFSFLF